MADLKYKKTPGFANIKGQMYETKMAALLFVRGLNSGYDFQLASNVDGAGALDDLVFRFMSQATAWTTIFIQLKQKERSCLKKQMLLEPKGNFSLQKYFESYHEIRAAMTNGQGSGLFDGKIEDCVFVLFTNLSASQDVGEARSPSLDIVENLVWTGTGSIHSFGEVGNEDVDEDVMARMAGFGGEGTDFLRQLLLFCGQLNESEMNAAIKDELRINLANTSAIDLDRVCDCFVENMRLWNEGSSHVLHKDSDILKHAVDRVVVETCCVLAKDDNLLDIRFEEASLSPLREALGHDFSVLHFQSSERSSRLSCTKILQALEGSYLFIGQKCLLKNHSAVSSELKHGKYESLILFMNCSESQIVESNLGIFRDVAIGAVGHGKRVVIITHVDNSLTESLALEMGDKFHCHKGDFEFTDIDKEAQEKFLRSEFNFQGNVIDVRTFLEDNRSHFVDFFRAAPFVEMIKSDQNVAVGPVLTDVVSYYVPRTLEKNTALKDDIFEGTPENITIILSSVQDLLSIRMFAAAVLKNIEKIFPKKVSQMAAELVDEHNGTIFVSKTFQLGKYEGQNVCLRNKVNSNVIALRIRPRGDILNQLPGLGWHLFLLEDASKEDEATLSAFNKSKHTLYLANNSLTWSKSCGQIDTIRKHIDHNQQTDFRLEMLTDVEDRLMLVCAEPGMGKTTLMTRVAKQTKNALPHFWVILLALNDHTKLFAQGRPKDCFAFLSAAAGITSDLHRSMLKYALEVTGNVCVLLDGYDEIAPKYANQCGDLLASLLGTKVKKVWVTSRNSMKKKLEDKLSTLAVKLRKFNEKEQISFLKQFWESKSILSEDELDAFIKRQLEKTASAISDREKHFLGIPLQLRMMAEILEDHVTGSATKTTLPDKLDLLFLLENFVEKKLGVFVQDKLKIKPHDSHYELQLDIHRESFRKNHINAALLLIISEENLEELHSKKIHEKASLFLNEITSRKDNIMGIIDSIENGKPRFTHRVFAEYFVAVWFAKHFSKNPRFVEKNLFLEDFGIIRMIFDRLLSKNCQLHVAVLHEDFEEVRELLDSGRVEVNAEDLGGRTALHLAAALGHSRIDEENQRRWRILELLISKTGPADFTQEDAVLNGSPLRYADMTQYWFAIDKLIPHYEPDHALQLVKTAGEVHNDNMFYFICTHDLDKLLKFCLDEGLKPDLNSTARLGNVPASLLASRGSSRVGATLLGCVPDSKKYPLHYAAGRGDLKTVKRLLQAKPDPKTDSESTTTTINRGDSQGMTPLHYAAVHGNVEVLTFLITQSADIFSRNKSGHTPLVWASLMGRTGVVHALLSAVNDNERGSYINTGNNDGKTPLYMAAFGRHKDVVQVLLDAMDASEMADMVKAGSNNSYTALHMAAEAGQTDLLKILLNAVSNAERPAFVTAASNVGNTALHMAVFNGHIEAADALLESLNKTERTAYINVCNSDGDTALNVATRKGHSELVTLLVEGGGRMSLANHAGQTPLLSAITASHCDVVLYLLESFDAEREGISRLQYVRLCDTEGRDAVAIAKISSSECLTAMVSCLGDEIGELEGSTC